MRDALIHGPGRHAPSGPPHIESVVPQIESVVPQIESVVPHIESVVPQIESVVAQIESVVPQIGSVVPQIESVVPQIESVVPQIESGVPQIESGVPQIESVDPQIGSVIPQIEFAAMQTEFARGSGPPATRQAARRVSQRVWTVAFMDTQVAHPPPEETSLWRIRLYEGKMGQKFKSAEFHPEAFRQFVARVSARALLQAQNLREGGAPHLGMVRQLRDRPLVIHHEGHQRQHMARAHVAVLLLAAAGDHLFRRETEHRRALHHHGPGPDGFPPVRLAV